MAMTPEEKKAKQAADARETTKLKREASMYFKNCKQCNCVLTYKNIAGITTNVCTKCDKDLKGDNILKYCIQCIKAKYLYRFSPDKKGYKKLCKECEGVIEVPDGMVRCIGVNGASCVNHEGPILAQNESNFQKEKGKYRNTCKQCRYNSNNTRRTQNIKDGLNIGKNCKKCQKIVTDVNEGRQECNTCYNQRKNGERTRYEHTPESIQKFKDSTQNQTRVCSRPNCNIEKPITEFDLRSDGDRKLQYRTVCINCEKIKTPVETIEEYRESTKDESKVCRECNQVKNVSFFRLDYDRVHLKYRSVCIRCMNKKGIQNRKEYNLVYYSNPGGIYDTYRMSARSKGLEFDGDLVWNLIESSCGYCGKQVKHGNMDYKIKGEYNGIDRIDNTRGYIKDNLLPCCSMCNYMKHDVDICSFIRKCCEIQRVSIDDYRLQYHRDKTLCGNSTNFSGYKYEAKKKKLVFELSEENFNRIISKRCFYCDKTNETCTIGVDRLDSDKGYVIGNVVACCNYCNYMKRHYDKQDFLNKVEAIVKYTEKNQEIDQLCAKNQDFRRNFEKKYNNK